MRIRNGHQAILLGGHYDEQGKIAIYPAEIKEYQRFVKDGNIKKFFRHTQQTHMNLADLPNFGPKSQQMLAQAGIHTIEQLRELGAVRAYLQVKRSWKGASLNLLWAMEGALTGRHWQDVAKHDRLRLLLELEDAENAHGK